VPELPVVSGSRELSVSRDLNAAVDDAFASDGPLTRALPAFEPRPGQREMASAVANVLTNGGTLLAEAGTGTGKTLAYLIPTILNRKRVLVSTGTKNLQEQIYSKDVPTLARALDVPFSATYMKGRGNYLCLHRFEQFKSEGNNPEHRIHLTLIDEWVKHTNTGDRAEVDELPDDLSFWGEIAATTENCLGSSCPRMSDCYITRMRQRAAESDVVIVNHHLLCADAAVRHHSFGEVIPECHVLVVDEAHQLEEIATQYFGITISNFKLEELVADALRVIRFESGPLGKYTGLGSFAPPTAANLPDADDAYPSQGGLGFGGGPSSGRSSRSNAKSGRASSTSSVNARGGFGGYEQVDMLRPGRAEIRGLVPLLDRIDKASRSFFGDLQWNRPAPPASSSGSGRSPAVPRVARELTMSADRAEGSARAAGLFDERVRLSEEGLDFVGESGLLLTSALDALEGAIRLVKEASEDLQNVGRRAAELRDQLRFLLRINDPSYVYFLEIRGRGVFLKASPIDVSSIVRELLLERMHATVLTSATLAVNGSFAYVRGRLGIPSAEEVRLPSEFDYKTQSLLYLPRKMPDPRDASFNTRVGDETIEILQRTEGRAFVLFTSYAAMRAIEARVAATLPYPLFVQGTAPRHVLLERFKQTPNAVLLATSSFWQGVDVVGDALSCVIIDKLPFASPGDPITAARIEAINARGGDAFAEYQVPLAILTLLQGLGRLLRHRTDRGILAILDPRLQTMGYGRRFLASLPPSPITRNLDDITRFFERDAR
jgi:ATP-dependent DNA helicase DinG